MLRLPATILFLLPTAEVLSFEDPGVLQCIESWRVMSCGGLLKHQRACDGGELSERGLSGRGQ